MTVSRTDSQQTTASINVTREDGERVQAVNASCHIRPGRSMSINVDVLDAAAITDSNHAEISAAVTRYIAEEMAKAATLGVPVAAAQ